MSSARSVAKELVRLSLSGPLPDHLTYFRLQCLAFYAQAWSLVLRESELFPEEIKATAEGPIIPELRPAGKTQTWQTIKPTTFDDELPLDAEDEALFLRHLWLAYGYLSLTGLFATIQGEPVFIKAKKQPGIGLIDTSELRESFLRHPGIPAGFEPYRRLLLEQEREAELAILTSTPLDVGAIWKDCRSVTPSASKQ